MLALVRRYARTHGPFPTARLAARYGVDPLPALRELERRGQPGPRRAAARRHRARVVRRRRAAPRSPRLAGAPSPGGRGGRPGRARPVPAELAERRRPPPGRRRAGPAARGAGPAAGSGADARGLGARRPAAPARRLQPGLARPAHHRRRDRLDRRRARSPAPAGSPSTSARTSGWPARRPRTPSSTAPEGELHDVLRERLGAAPCFWIDLVAELEACAGGAPRGALGPGLGRRGHQRRLRAAARPPALGGPEPGAPGSPLLPRAASPPAAPSRAAGR